MEPDERDAWAATNLTALPGEKADPAVFGAWVLAQRVAILVREEQAARGERAA